MWPKCSQFLLTASSQNTAGRLRGKLGARNDSAGSKVEDLSHRNFHDLIQSWKQFHVCSKCETARLRKFNIEMKTLGTSIVEKNQSHLQKKEFRSQEDSVIWILFKNHREQKN